VWSVDRADHIGGTAFYGGDENRAGITEFRVGSIKIGRAQNGGAHSGGRISCQNQVFLLLAHLALEGDRISRMGFVHEVGLGNAVGINGAHVNETSNAGCGCDFERDPNQFGMELELSVGDPNGIKNSVDSCCGASGSDWVTEVGFTVFDERFVGAEMAPQALLGASYNSKAGSLFC
jgi:hypothetical protein